MSVPNPTLHANTARVPIQTSFGRRPVLLFSTLICLASNIWRAKAKTYSSFMGACVLNGIGAGPAEVRYRDTPLIFMCNTNNNQTAQPTIIADVMFLHERGAYNTLYFTFYFGSLMVCATESDWLLPLTFTGRPHRIRTHGRPRWLEKLLVAKCCS